MKHILINNKSEHGFSLLEALIAISILLVVMLGVFSVFTYAVIYNTGNNTRSQALSVLQREVELYRSYKFVPTFTDAELTGGVKAVKYPDAAADGSQYKVEVTIDDDPTTSGTQTVVSPATTSFKEITIVVTPRNQVAAWQTANSVQVVMQRVRGN